MSIKKISKEQPLDFKFDSLSIFMDKFVFIISILLLDSIVYEYDEILEQKINNAKIESL